MIIMGRSLVLVACIGSLAGVVASAPQQSPLHPPPGHHDEDPRSEHSTRLRGSSVATGRPHAQQLPQILPQELEAPPQARSRAATKRFLASDEELDHLASALFSKHDPEAEMAAKLMAKITHRPTPIPSPQPSRPSSAPSPAPSRLPTWVTPPPTGKPVVPPETLEEFLTDKNLADRVIPQSFELGLHPGRLIGYIWASIGLFLMGVIIFLVISAGFNPCCTAPCGLR